MSQRQCPGCGCDFRRGTAVTLLMQSGEMQRRIVCPKCVARAILLVAEVKSYLDAVSEVIDSVNRTP